MNKPTAKTIVKLCIGNDSNLDTKSYAYNDILNSQVLFQFQKLKEITITDVPVGQEDNISRFIFNCVSIFEQQEENQKLFKTMKEI